MQVTLRANSRFALTCLAGYIVLASSSTLGARLPLEPEETVREFYGTLGRQDCEAATRLRPGYRKEECLRVSNVKLHRVILESQSNQQARVFVEVTYVRGKRESFCGYVNLEETEYGWTIKGKYDKAKCKLPIAGGVATVALGTTLTKKEQHSNVQGLEQVRTQSEHPAMAIIKAFCAALAARVHINLAPTLALIEERNKLWNKILPRAFRADQTASTRFPASFGSAAILRTCWTPEDLKGDSAERAIIKPLPIPDTNPPLRSAPESSTPEITSASRGSIRKVDLPDGQKLVALTFDLCEQVVEKTGYDGAIVDYLRSHQIKATLFAGGKWMRSHSKRTMQLMADPLFEIGNHAWTHGNLRTMHGTEMRNQIAWTQAQYEILWEDLKRSRCVIDAGIIKEMNRIPRLPRIFRFPYGACSTESLQEAAQLGLAAIQWNIVTADSAPGQTARAIADTILKNVTPGSIIIAHANGRGRHTAAALSIVVPELKKRGYEFATVSELLARGTPIAEDTCYELKPGDNKRYDKLFGNGTGL